MENKTSEMPLDNAEEVKPVEGAVPEGKAAMTPEEECAALVAMVKKPPARTIRPD